MSLELHDDGTVISLVSTVSAKHWRDYLKEYWKDVTHGVTSDEIRLMVMAGVHGNPDGKVGDDAKNVQDCRNQAVILSFKFGTLICQEFPKSTGGRPHKSC